MHVAKTHPQSWDLRSRDGRATGRIVKAKLHLRLGPELGPGRATPAGATVALARVTRSFLSPKEPATVPNIITRFVVAVERWLTQRTHASHQNRDKSSASRSLEYDAYIRANVNDAKSSDRNS